MWRLLLVGIFFVTTAHAQSRPPKLEPLPEPPPPPPLPTLEEPTVRIPVQKEDKIEEIREGGRVVMLKVTPPNGPTYYLVEVQSPSGTVLRRKWFSAASACDATYSCSVTSNTASIIDSDMGHSLIYGLAQL